MTVFERGQAAIHTKIGRCVIAGVLDRDTYIIAYTATTESGAHQLVFGLSTVEALTPTDLDPLTKAFQELLIK